MAAGHTAAVPKFGSWDAENIGYTVFFEKVRDNKGPPAPAPAATPKAPGGYDFDPYEHYENLSRKVPSRPPSSHGHAPPAQAAAAPSNKAPGGYVVDFDPYEHYESLSSRNVPSRPPSSQGHGPARAAAPRAHGAGYDYENLSGRNAPSRPPSSHGHAPPPQQHHRGGSNGYHRRTGSNGSSVASETSSRASKFSPPRPYHPRYSSSSNDHHHRHQEAQQRQQGAGVAYGNNGSRGQYDHHHPQGAPSAGHRPYSSLSPPRGPPPPLRRPKASAVPKFGVWDEQNAATAAQGFTVQFEKVKRHREEAKAAAAPPAPSQRNVSSPDRYAPEPAPRHGRKRRAHKSFLSKVYRCMFPVVRE